MKKSLILLLSLFVLVGIAHQDAYAQKKSKKEKKTKMKKSDMILKIENLTSALKEAETKNNSLSDQLTNLQDEINGLEDELEASKAALMKAEEDIANMPTVGADPVGLTFRVQIGAYNTIQLANLFKEPKLITAEDVDGVNKYMVGHFDSFEAAKSLESALRKAGLKDAWLVPYNDGFRISDDAAADLLGMPIREK